MCRTVVSGIVRSEFFFVERRFVVFVKFRFGFKSSVAALMVKSVVCLGRGYL